MPLSFPSVSIEAIFSSDDCHVTLVTLAFSGIMAAFKYSSSPIVIFCVLGSVMPVTLTGSFPVV